MRFGIYSNSNRDIEFAVASKTALYLIDKGVVPVFPAEFCDTLLSSIKGAEFACFDDCDMIISIGGDGTLLSVVSKYRDLCIPFVGINKGSIGFLSEISCDRLEASLDKLIARDYQLIERCQLKADVFDKEGNCKASEICLNDAVVTRGMTLHVVNLVFSIDNSIVEHFYGDGMIVSTPTGSTAYNLAAGGPILMNDIKNMIVTPLCSHTLNNSSYVTDAKRVIEITLMGEETDAVFSADGRPAIPLKYMDKVIISMYNKPVKTIELGYSSFFSKVQKKIIARGSFYENREE